MRVLFVCSRNKLRSPTAEAIFSGRSGWEVASAGLNKDAKVPLTAELVRWAERIYVMERVHRERMQRRFGRELKGKEIKILGIADNYEFMDARLVTVLRRKVG